MTHEQALAALARHRRILEGRRWVFWASMAVMMVAMFWVGAQEHVSSDLLVTASFVPAVLLAVGLVVSQGPLQWLREGGAGDGVQRLMPATVHAAGAQEVLVRATPAGRGRGPSHAPDASALDDPDRGEIWRWSLTRGQPAPPVGHRVWVRADLETGRTPIVIPGAPGRRPGGDARVLWPLTPPSRDIARRFVLTGRDGEAIRPGEPAPSELVRAARRAARPAVLWNALFLGFFVAAASASLVLGWGQGAPGPTTEPTFLLFDGVALVQVGPPLAGAWQLWRARGLRRAIVADSRAGLRSRPTRRSWCSSVVRRPPPCGGGR